MATANALARLAALLIQRAEEQGIPRYRFPNIPIPSKFWAAPTGEAFGVARPDPRHHLELAEGLGFARGPKAASARQQAMRAGLIRGRIDSPEALWAEFGTKPDTLAAMMDLIGAMRPEQVLMDVVDLPTMKPYGLRTREPRGAIRDLSELYRATPDRAHLLAILKSLALSGLLPLMGFPTGALDALKGGEADGQDV